MFRRFLVVTVLTVLSLALVASVVQANCGGCTHTPGYWKTHSAYGPAPYDDTWAFIGEDTEFFSGNGYSWYEMMHVPPKGRPYVLLAHQYIAAQLNFLAGADPTAIFTDFGQATVLLSVYTVDYDWKTDPDGVAGDLKDLAEALGDYNDGSIGPGLCGS